MKTSLPFLIFLVSISASDRATVGCQTNEYSGTSLIRTPEMRTPRFNGHFAQVRNLSQSLLYIFTSEMRTPRYSVYIADSLQRPDCNRTVQTSSLYTDTTDDFVL